MNITAKFKNFIQNSRHILSISYRPNRAEFDKSAKIIIIGILITGTLGFVIAVVISLLVTGTLAFI